MGNKVRFSSRAVESLDAADAFLRPLDPSAANNLRDEVEQPVRLIAEFPAMGKAIAGSGLRYHVTRHYRYRILYRVIGSVIEIRGLIHPRRQG